MSRSLRITILILVNQKDFFLCQVMVDKDVLCLQEHFLLKEGLALLQLDGCVEVCGA
jgi:hypothetical protein